MFRIGDSNYEFMAATITQLIILVLVKGGRYLEDHPS